MEGGRERSTAVPLMFLRAVFQRLAGTPATQYKTWSPADLEKVHQQVGWGHATQHKTWGGGRTTFSWILPALSVTLIPV